MSQTAVNFAQGGISIPSGPSGRMVQVVPSDSVTISPPYRGLYVGGFGDIKVTDASGNAVIFYSVPAGTTLTGLFTLIWATGTTATGMVGYV